MNLQPGRDVRSRVIEALQKFKIKQIEVARQTGMHHSTLCLWLQGKIKGHQVKIEETLEKWLENLSQNKMPFSKNPPAKGFGQKNSEYKEPVMETEKVEAVPKPFTRDDELIPVRIDIESEGIRFKENISWNMSEPILTPEGFAKLVADDNGLPPIFENEITLSIKKAIQAYRKYVSLQPEMIRVIELDVRVENVCLKDRFEWDINDPHNNPEEFALNLCNDLGLNHEFITLIAHSIREQIQSYQRQAMERGLADFRNSEEYLQMKKSTRSLIESGTTVMKKAFEPIIITEENYLRNVGPVGGYPIEMEDLSRWEPRIEIIDPKDIGKVKKLEDRKTRYEKRHR